MAYQIEQMRLEEIVSCCGGVLTGNGDAVIENISTDSRDIANNCLFVPLKGERFDGHDYINVALDHGAVAVIYDHGDASGFSCTVKVEDTRKALLDIAAYYRSKFDVQMVGLTGSVGKTTTKEMLAAVCETTFSTLKTKGNFNNEIGVPLTLFGLRSDHRAAVIEMGMSHFGEISALTRCAKPQVAIITNIGVSHMENLGSREGILQAKCEIFEGLPEGGTVILNGDDPYLFGIKGTQPFNMIYYGMENAACELRADVISDGADGIFFVADGEEYRLGIPGKHNVYNALAAIALGKLWGISPQKIKEGLAAYRPDGIRQTIYEKNGKIIIADCYNASPQSMMSSIDVLKTVGAGRRTVAVLGDMAELGAQAGEFHTQVGEYAAQAGITAVIAVGSHAKEYAAGASNGCEVHTFSDREEMNAFLDDYLREGDAVLVKGSRVMALEQVVAHLTGEK